MRKSTKIAIIGGVIVTGIIIYLQLETGFITKAIGNKKIKDTYESYYKTYGLTKEEWELLESEGITVEDANALEFQATRRGEVGDLLEDIVQQIKAGTYQSEEDMEEDLEENASDFNLSSLEGHWVREDYNPQAYDNHIYIKVDRDDDSASIEYYDNSVGLTLRKDLSFIEKSSDENKIHMYYYNKECPRESEDYIFYKTSDDDTIRLDINDNSVYLKKEL